MTETASNRQRSRLRNRIWAIMRDASGEGVYIYRDPMGYRYEVNRFGVHVDYDTMDEAMIARERALALLIVGGWTVDRENPKKVSRFTATPDGLPCRAVVDVPFEKPTGGATMHISIC